MLKLRGDAGRKFVAIMAIAIMLVIANAALLVGHWHASLHDCSCDICRTCNLTTPEPLRPMEIQAPTVVEWRKPSFEVRLIPEPELLSSSPRGPPA